MKRDAGQIDALQARLGRTSGAERVECILEIADLLRHRDPARAFEMIEEAGRLLEREDRPSRSQRVRVLLFRSACHGALSRMRQALGDAERAALELDGTCEPEIEASAYHRIGAAKGAMDDVQGAREALETGLAIQRKNGDRGPVTASLLTSLGNVHFVAGEFERALKFYEEALAIRRERREEEKEAGLLGNIANVSVQLSDHARALESYERAAAAHREAGDLAGQSIALQNIANLLAAVGAQEDALETLRRCLGIQREIGDRWGEAKSLLTLSGVRTELGDLTMASDALERLMAIAREIESPSLEGTAYARLAVIHRLEGDLVLARECADRCLEIGGIQDDGKLIALGLAELGELQLERREFEVAVETLQAALSHVKPGRHRVWAAMLENSLAQACEGAGDLECALRHQRKSAEIEREVLRRNADARLARARAVHEVAQARFEAEDAERAALRRSEVRLRAILENTPNVAIQGYDIAGRIQLWNGASDALFGWSTEDAIDSSAMLILDEPEAARFAEVLREIDRTGRGVEPGEWRVNRKDGSVGTVLSTVFQIVDDRGEKLFIRMDVDITERKRMEVALAESEERFSTAFHASPNAIAITAIEDGRLIEINRAFERIFGYSREEALGRTTAELKVWWTDADRAAIVEDLRAGMPVRNRELPFRRKSGEAGVAELSMERIDLGGEACLLTVTRDVTERKETESALRAALAEVDLLKRRLESENIYLREEIRAEHGDHEMVGESEAFLKLRDEIRAVAGTESTVLLVGETGTGKELVARALHDLGPRGDRPLVKVNCSAVSASLFESELFGHEKGAFTGADRRRQGRFEVAHGGTIFLDEIGDLPPEIQSKLLRVLEEREFERVGSSEPIQVDVRVIAATNRDLEAAIEEGAFRSDLFYRLNVYPIRVPALRDRKSDIPLLAGHLLEHASRRLGRTFDGFHPDALDRMCRYDWPGNIRELRNLVDRAAILSPGGRLELAPTQASPQRRPAGVGESQDLQSVERDHILGVLEGVGWVVEGDAGAAEVLELKPSTLRHRMKKLGIRRPGGPPGRTSPPGGV